MRLWSTHFLVVFLYFTLSMYVPSVGSCLFSFLVSFFIVYKEVVINLCNCQLYLSPHTDHIRYQFHSTAVQCGEFHCKEVVAHLCNCKLYLFPRTDDIRYYFHSMVAQCCENHVPTTDDECRFLKYRNLLVVL